MKEKLLFGLLFVGLCLFGCDFNESITDKEDDEEIGELLLVPKEQENDLKSHVASTQQFTPYSCYISTLADDEAEYNYWNQSFWLYLPQEAVDQANGKTTFKAFSFSSKDAGDKAGSWAGKDNIVRVAQCMIPDSKLAEEMLALQLQKFGEGTWLESRSSEKSTNQQHNLQSNTSGGEWECTEAFVTIVCEVDSETGNTTDCVLGFVECLSYEFVHNEPIGGGGGGGSGTPGHDPGECDPMSTEPCHDGPGGSEPPPPEPDPCEEDDPPVYCENPCETGDPVLDDNGIQRAFEKMWEDSNYGSDSNPNDEIERQEQVGFIIPDDSGGYTLQQLPSSLINSGPCAVRFQYPTDLPEGTILIHTHPYSNNEPQNHCIEGKTFHYKSEPGVKDRPALDSIGIEEGIILDADNVIRFTTNESEEPILNDRCGY